MKFKINCSLNLVTSGALAFLGLIWAYCLFLVPEDSFQGQVYRILYVHVPSAFCAFFFSFLLCLISLKQLTSSSDFDEEKAKAIAEVGFVFTCLTLFTGSIWGRPTWGTWWTWDARLTTTFLLSLLYVGYLILWSSVSQPSLKRVSTAILGILIFVDVPIIYKSVTWWRTLHQPPSIFRNDGGSTMAPEMLWPLCFAMVGMLLVALLMSSARYRVLVLENQLKNYFYRGS